MTNETSGEKCEAAPYMLTSNPPQYRCVNCNKTWYCHDPVPNCAAAKKQVTPLPTSGQEENKIKAEMSVFWDTIASYLPKSVERAALGDEKIFNAVYRAYTEFRPHLVNTPLPTSGEESWEIEFDKQFEANIWRGKAVPDEIKAFIRSLLAQERKESQKLIEAIHLYNTDAIKALQEAKREAQRELIEALEKAFEPAHTYSSENADVYRAYDNGYKQALAHLRRLTEGEE